MARKRTPVGIIHTLKSYVPHVRSLNEFLRQRMTADEFNRLKKITDKAFQQFLRQTTVVTQTPQVQLQCGDLVSTVNEVLNYMLAFI